MIESVKAAPPVEKCAHCGKVLPRVNGHLAYWSELRPGVDGWPVSVKVCRDCRYKWQHGEEDAQHGR